MISIDEINKLKQDIESYKQSEQEANEIIAELKAENERLKKEIRLYDCIEKWGTKECHCACRCLGNEFCEDADKKINNYKQALAEIKEIAKRDCGNCPYNQNCDYIFQECEESKIDDILQKISEVTNG